MECGPMEHLEVCGIEVVLRACHGAEVLIVVDRISRGKAAMFCSGFQISEPQVTPPERGFMQEPRTTALTIGTTLYLSFSYMHQQQQQSQSHIISNITVP